MNQTGVIAEAEDRADLASATREHARPDRTRPGRLGAESWLRVGACAGGERGGGATSVTVRPRLDVHDRPNADGMNPERHRVRLHAMRRPNYRPLVAEHGKGQPENRVCAVSKKYAREASLGDPRDPLVLFTKEVRRRSGPLGTLRRRSWVTRARCALSRPHPRALHPDETEENQKKTTLTSPHP